MDSLAAISGPAVSKRWNGRKLAFVEAYVRTGVQVQAAIEAGYSPRSAARRAQQLLQEDIVVAEIGKRQDELRKRNEVTLDSLIEQLREDREHARECGQAVAAVRATELLGRLTGLLVDRSKVDVTHTVDIGDRLERGLERAREARQIAMTSPTIEADASEVEGNDDIAA